MGSQASLIVDMPLSRTRSLLANINTSASATVSASATSDNSSGYSSHFSDTQHLPPLKSKLIGGPGTLFSGVTGNSNGDNNCDSMSINGSIVSNGSVTSGGGGGTGTNGHTNGMATLPLVRPTTGDNVSRNSTTLESPKHDSSSQQNGSTSSLLKPKTMVASPEQVMKLYMNKLTPYEHHEIFNYPQIYFIGANAKKRPGIIGGPNNCGYDDEQGSYTHIAHDHIAYRYEILKVIGKGSFGQVLKVYDHKTHQHVALKMVRKEKRFHRQAQEEIRILEHLRRQDKDNSCNIIHML